MGSKDKALKWIDSNHSDLIFKQSKLSQDRSALGNKMENLTFCKGTRGLVTERKRFADLGPDSAYKLVRGYTRGLSMCLIRWVMVLRIMNSCIASKPTFLARSKTCDTSSLC